MAELVIFDCDGVLEIITSRRGGASAAIDLHRAEPGGELLALKKGSTVRDERHRMRLRQAAQSTWNRSTSKKLG